MGMMKRLAMELADTGVDINDQTAVDDAMWWVHMEHDQALQALLDEEEAMLEEQAAMEDERNFAGATAWDYC